jgi:PAS domain S-box-containing protein
VYTWVNPAGHKFIGGDVIGKRADYYFEGDQDTFSRIAPIFQGDKNIIYLESWQRRFDGEKRLLAWWCRTLKDNNGHVRGALSTARDITGNKIKEKALQESEEKLRNIFDTVPEGITITTLDGEIINSNRAAFVLHGYQSKDEITGRNSQDFIAEKDRVNYRKYIVDTLEHGLIGYLKCSLIKKDGVEFPAELNAVIMKDDRDVPNGIILVTADITRRLKADEEHQKIIEYKELDRLKTNLLSTVSHELRTPLATIKGYASLLLTYDRKLDEKQKVESLEAIDRSTDRLAELIDHLLDMSRLDAGLLRMTLMPLKLRDTITAAMHDAELRAPRFHFITEIKGRLPVIMADSRRLRQIIDNIVENAIKYSPEETTITMRVAVKDTELWVSVTDQGRGIADSEKVKIFDRMYRIEQRLQKDPGGLGLGLSLCKALVEAHGGRIWVESIIDKGSTFYFTLPLKLPDKGNKDDEREQVKGSARN